jgi:thioredoxin 1
MREMMRSQLAPPPVVAPPKPSVLILTAANFEQVVNQAKPTLVDFWAEWCGPCRVMHPILERLSTKYAARISFGRLNVDEAGDIAARFQVFSIPTFILFRAGRAIDSVIGAVGERGLETLILRNITPAD